MPDNKLKEEIEQVRSRKEMPFWSILLVFISLLHGIFIVRFCGYLTAHSGIDITVLVENLIGGGLMLFALLKAIAMVGDFETLRKISILSLSFIWSGLLFISLVYSFGIGSPNPDWYFYAVIVFASFRVSFKGGY